ncbi:MAG: ABC transporter permease [Chloroflexi bacterium]|nr:ABC transporter permease [Chloroflexota bacterium]
MGLESSGLASWMKAVSNFIYKALVVAEMEARKVRRDPIELIMRSAGPVFWLLVFGQVLNRARVIPTGELSYLDYMTPGILAQGMLFTAIFYGISTIWERDLGVLHKFLASPVPRSALVAGKALSAGVRAVPQALAIGLLGVLVGVHISHNPLSLLGALLTIVLSSALFATFSLIIACIVKRGERLVGINQVIIMPLFFASNAIYPISIMPEWLKVLSHINPLTYTVDALRAMMVEGGQSQFGVGWDILFLAVITVVFNLIASRLYQRILT